MALCSPLAGRAFAAGPAPGAAATSVRTQRRKRPPLLPLLGDLLGWVQQASGIWNPILVQAAAQAAGVRATLSSRSKEDMWKEKVSRPLLLCIFSRQQGPSAPISVFLEESRPKAPLLWASTIGEAPTRHNGYKQMPLSLLPPFATAFFAALERPAHPACPPSRDSSSGAAGITRPTLSAAVKFPVKPRGDCHLPFRA